MLDDVMLIEDIADEGIKLSYAYILLYLSNVSRP